jgi:putative PIN family toxin of toxin-antitoxin system
MEKNPLNIVLDTNVVISALLFGGKPRQIIKLVQEGKLTAYISSILVAELIEILVKKFMFSSEKIMLLEELIKENFIIIYPAREIHVARDEDDNRVLEAALEGNCSFIITGDKDLLDLKNYKKIAIITPDIFLQEVLD